MKAKDLREMTDDQLEQELAEQYERIKTFRIQMATGTVDNVRAFRNARRDIARIKTVQRQRELAAKQEAGEQR